MNLLVLILIVVLLLGGVGSLPVWSHSANWGPAPSGLITLFVVILLILLLTGRL